MMSMPLRDVDIGENLGLARGEAIVCVPVCGAYDLFVQCLRSLFEHTEQTTPLLICDDASADPRIRAAIEEGLAGGERTHRVYYLRQPENVGFVENVNTAMRSSAPADVVVLNSDCMVSRGWFSALRAAAYSESRVATATALTNAGTIVSIPRRNHPLPQLPQELSLERSAEAVRRESLRLRPDIPTCVGHCTYIRRSAIELVGAFDPVFSPGYEEEVDFSQRCLKYGLRHVVADDVFVYHRHAGTFGRSEESVLTRARHHAVISERYPYYDSWIEEVRADQRSRLAHSLSVACSALRGTSVTIDGRCLGEVITGTQLVTLGIIGGLDVYTDLRVRVLVPDALGGAARGFLEGRPNIRLLTRRDLEAGVEPTDVVHRPYQVADSTDLAVLTRLGHRLVLSQLDNIALRNPHYFPDFAAWRSYRDLTCAALSAADQVVFISRHAAEDARTLGLVSNERINVVAPSTEQTIGREEIANAPSAAPRVADRPFLLCLGTDFVHKNRVFALRLLEALGEEGLFDGRLVFAGPKVAAGSSAGEEASYLLARPDLAESVLDVGVVDEGAKSWLLEKAAAVLYPTTYEGFGLTPFEAADAGTPCLFAAHTSLAEVLPERVALLVPWDPRESARRVAPVLVPGEAREEHVRSIRIAGARFTTSSSARALAGVYAKALRSARTQLISLATLADQLQHGTPRSTPATYDDPLALGSKGASVVVPAELRRPLLAITGKPLLRRTTIALYRAGYALRHSAGKRPEAGEES